MIYYHSSHLADFAALLPPPPLPHLWPSPLCSLTFILFFTPFWTRLRELYLKGITAASASLHLRLHGRFLLGLRLLPPPSVLHHDGDRVRASNSLPSSRPRNSSNQCPTILAPLQGQFWSSTVLNGGQVRFIRSRSFLKSAQFSTETAVVLLQPPN